MSLYAVKARGENGFRRAGIAFAFTAWTLVEDPPLAILKETHLECVDLTEPNVQRKIGVRPFTNLNDFEDHPDLENLEGPAPNYKVLFDEQVTMNDALKQENDRLTSTIEEHAAANDALKQENDRLNDQLALTMPPPSRGAVKASKAADASTATPGLTTDQLNQAAVATADSSVQTQTAPTSDTPADPVDAPASATT